MTTDTVSPSHAPAPPDDLCDELARVLQTAIARGKPADMGAIQTCVRGYVRQLRATDVPPERMIVAVKEIARRCGVEGTRMQVPGEIAGTSLMQSIVQWSIAEYYRAD